MDNEKIVQQVMEQLKAKADKMSPDCSVETTYCIDPTGSGLTEYVGYNKLGDTIGFVIANIDPALHEIFKIDTKYRSIGVITARSGAGPHAMAADEAVKSTNTELIVFETPNDTKGGGGHGCMVLFAAEDVSDARRAVEITLEGLEWTFGGVIGNENSFIEVQYTSRASHVLSRYFFAEEGKAWGLINGCPSGIAILMSDAAFKAADVKVTGYGSPVGGQHTNEFTTFIVGDSGAVKQAICTAREVGIKLMRSLGQEPVPSGREYF